MAFQKSLVFFICQCITTIVAVDALSFVSYTTYINSNSEKDVQCIQFDFRKISFISLELSDQSLHSLPRLCSPSTPDGEYRSGLWLCFHPQFLILTESHREESKSKEKVLRHAGFPIFEIPSRSQNVDGTLKNTLNACFNLLLPT